jgi:hypothetical protein
MDHRAMRSGTSEVDAGDGAIAGAVVPCLPARLLDLINPDVLAARAAVVRARATDPHDRVRRRRCAEVVATHLLAGAEHD